MDFRYPITTEEIVSEEFFGMTVDDPYRWLEDDRSQKTEDWVDAQNEVSFAYLSSLPSKAVFQERLERLAKIQKRAKQFLPLIERLIR